jgi:hypothetical protein
MAFLFATRPYGPESTPEEIQAMRERIFVAEPGIVFWHEIPMQCGFSMQLMTEHTLALIRQQGACGLVVDLTEAQPPSAEVRGLVRPSVEQLIAATRRYVVFTGKNFLLNATAKFILGAMFGFGRVGLQRTRDEAMQEVRDALGKR